MQARKGAYEVTVETVASGVSVGKYESLRSLTWRPQVCKQRGIPVDLVEKMRFVLPTFWTISVSWELHIGLVRIQALGRVVAGWKVDVSTEGRSIAITILVREADTGASVCWILDPDPMETI